MATRTQRLIWTALPNGFSDDGRRLRLSALVSPRLAVTPGPDDVLAAFPDWLEWPAIVRDATFDVALGPDTASAIRVSEPDDAVHARLFAPSTTVLSRAFEDRRGTHVLSFPAAAVERDLSEVYGALASEADGELPLLDDLRARFAGLGRQLRGLTHQRLLEELRSGQGGDPERGDVARHLGWADLYHTPLAAIESHNYVPTGPDDPRTEVSWKTYALTPLPAPGSFRRTIDVHAIVSALAQYPALLRLTGLVVDLEVERDAFPDAATGAALSLGVSWTSRPGTAGAGVTIEPDVQAQTRVLIDERRFTALSRTPEDPPVRDGFLTLAKRDFDLLQVDVNGSALKLRQFAITMFQSPGAREQDAGAPPDPVAPPPDRTGTPSLRSGGLTLALRGRAGQLSERFDRSGAMEDALQAGDPVVLHQEDLVRGFHPEVEDATVGAWRSLCRRDTHFAFTADASELSVDDCEGMVRLAAARSADGSAPDVVKLYEGVFTWSGWSLAAPPVGRSVGPDDAVADGESVAPDGLPLDVAHRVRPRSLPSLRYGRGYRVRMRVADLAGNSLPFDPGSSAPPSTETGAVELLRYEPIEGPTFALVGTGAAAELPGPGEDLATAAIRSLNAVFDDEAVSPQTARRHVVPPAGAQQLAERHGMLDAGGRVDPNVYALLAARDGALSDVIHPVTGKPFPTTASGATPPFLPDPLAREVVVRIEGRSAPGAVEVLRVPWFAPGAAWPDARVVRVEAFEPDDAGAVPSVDEKEGVVRVPLAKADWARVRVSHGLTDDALALLGVWRWALEHAPSNPAARQELLDLAREGRHWMLTPWRDLELVHAVQRPLVVPAVEDLKIRRPTGSTVAKLSFTTPVDSRSTEKLDLFGRWLDPLDDPDDRTGPKVLVGGGARAAELKLHRLEAPGVTPPGRRDWRRRPVAHDLGDTRYRRVGYRLTGTTRFGRFLPAGLQAPEAAAELTVTSDEAIGFVPCSAPPPAPDIVYVIPTFGWSRNDDGDGDGRSWRDGGGLRVYLRRPWLVSGFMEMLAVVLPRPRRDRGPDPALGPLVTQWGADPVWGASGIAGAAPPPSRFALATTAGPVPQAQLDPSIPAREGDLPAAPFDTTGLPLPGAPGTATVDIAPHLVRFDPVRRLWYADIVVDPGTAYAPFLRLALARYQPISAPGSHLSPVAVAEVVQLLPDRLLVVTRRSGLLYRVALYGHAPSGRSRGVDLEVERLAPDAVSDLEWEPLPDVRFGPVPAPHRPSHAVQIDTPTRTRAQRLLKDRRFQDLVLEPNLVEALRPPLIREAEVQLPRSRETGERFRLVVTESELRPADRRHLEPAPSPGRDPRRKPVYLETAELR